MLKRFPINGIRGSYKPYQICYNIHVDFQEHQWYNSNIREEISIWVTYTIAHVRIVGIFWKKYQVGRILTVLTMNSKKDQKMEKFKKLSVFSNFSEAEDLVSFLTRTGQVKQIYIQEKKRFWQKQVKWEIWAIKRKWR